MIGLLLVAFAIGAVSQSVRDYRQQQIMQRKDRLRERLRKACNR